MIASEIRTNDKGKILFRGRDPLYSVSISPDGSCGLDAGGSVDMVPGIVILNQTNIKKVKFIGSAAVRIWKTETRELLALLSGHERPVVAALFITNDKVATLSFDGDLRITCLSTQKVIQSGKKIMGRSEALVYLPTKGLLVTTMGDRSVRAWDVDTGKEQFVLFGHQKNYFLWSATVHPGNELLVSGSDDGSVIFWDLQKKQAAQSMTLKSAPYGLAWHPDGVRLFIATAGRLMVVDGKSGKTLNELDSEQHNLRAVAVSPDGTLVAAGGGGTYRAASSKKNSVIHVWNVKTGRKEIRLVGHSQIIRSLVFKPDGKGLLSVSSDRTLRSWQVV